GPQPMPARGGRRRPDPGAGLPAGHHPPLRAGPDAVRAGPGEGRPLARRRGSHRAKDHRASGPNDRLRLRKFSSMKRTSLLFVLAVFAAAAGEAAGLPSRQYTIEQLLATTSITGASFSADEKKILFSSDKTG